MGCRTVSVDAGKSLDSLTSWDADWKGLRVVVAGLGLSGFSAADTLIELGAIVTVIDGRDDQLNQQRAETLKIVGAHEVLLGDGNVQALPLVNGKPAQLVMVS
ncbi:MAG: UDP-N-acetylmuramoyl-L-alanine--D-glutamate ligase, partial [Glutamicibacter sp.]